LEVAGRRQRPLAVDFDDADPAPARLARLAVVAERRNVDPGSSGRFQNGLVWLRLNGLTVNRDSHRGFSLPSACGAGHGVPIVTVKKDTRTLFMICSHWHVESTAFKV
jgi:hypothetical protein